jgi:CRP-like cAMP-binding protein
MSEALRRFALLRDLSAEELELVASLLEASALRSGRTLFREGQEADGLWLVEKGSLEITSRRHGELGEVEEGEGVGALSLVTVGAREVSARAGARETTLLHLSRTAFLRLRDDSPRAASRMLEAIASDLAGLLRRGLDRVT